MAINSIISWSLSPLTAESKQATQLLSRYEEHNKIPSPISVTKNGYELLIFLNLVSIPWLEEILCAGKRITNERVRTMRIQEEQHLEMQKTQFTENILRDSVPKIKKQAEELGSEVEEIRNKKPEAKN